MKKLFVILGIVVILLASGVYATTLADEERVKSFVKDVAKEKGISEEEIEDVEEVNFEKLPEQVKLENIDETNLAMYKVKKKNQNESIFVITVSETKFKKTLKNIANKMLLNFGFSEEFNESMFLQTSTGVQGSSEKGYVMMRQGSITGLSTNLEILEVNEPGTVDVVIYKNQKPIGFRNTIAVETEGIKKDYDVVSMDTITFEAGDVISVYAEVKGNVVVSDVINIIEINTLE